MAQSCVGPRDLLTLVVLLCPLLWAQQPTTEIRVEVKDTSGAATPAASGLLENLSLGTKQNFQTDDQGRYTLTRLPFGRYRLQISREGFATQSSVFELDSATPVTRAISLEVGVTSYAVDVISATPLAGVDRSLEEIPAPVQAGTERDIQASGALDLADFLNRRMKGVYLNEVQNNPMQPDLNYRGYTASPLL
ncbi:MAG TPA: carboxypeptidase-like regulatory domain-containing protein, partial [Bryobacteraceae bacterium]|nr:carboxypeptidase-like regulatory domain-containing protein [Bryobacteraceae bacterium]